MTLAVAAAAVAAVVVLALLSRLLGLRGELLLGVAAIPVAALVGLGVSAMARRLTGD